MLALLVAFASSAARADWPAGGKLVCTPGGVNGNRNVMLLPDPSGDLVVVGQGRGGISYPFAIQRVSLDGVIAPGWPAEGFPSWSTPVAVPLRSQDFVLDDGSRLWNTWANGVHGFLRTLSEAAVSSPSYDLGTPSSLVSRAAPAPGGEVFVVCGARLRRLTIGGTAAAGWTSTGVPLYGDQYDDYAAIPDGAGGVLVFTRLSLAAAAPVVTRFDGNGAVHAGWDAFGVPLTADPVDAFRDDSQLLLSGPDHALAVWSASAGAGLRRVILQRIGFDGVLDPAWPENGLEIVAPDTLVSCRAIPDGSGGVYVVRESHHVPVATHVASNGTVVGGADTNLLDAAAQYVPPDINLGATTDQMIADVTPDGGLLVGWNDTRLAPATSYRLRWMTPSLTPSAVNADSALVYFPASPHPGRNLMALRADGTDGAFLAWSDYHDLGFSTFVSDIWMTRVQASALLDVEPAPAPRGLTLAAPRPNPARTAVAFNLTLPDDAPARLELLDIAGRVRRTQLVQGAGAHTATFDRLGALAPGLYLARLTGRGGTAVVRVAVTR